MANFFSLLKVQLISFLGVNRLLKSKKKTKALGFGGIALLLVILGGLMAFLGYTYSKSFALSLSVIGQGEKLIPLMLAIACLICFMFSFYAIGSALFSFKDYDILMSMPLKPCEIVLSKFSVVYASELFFTIFIVIPSLFVYNSLIAVISEVQIITTIALCILAPFLPLAISTLLGVIVYYISSRFRKKNIIQIILLMLIMLGLFTFSFLLELWAEDPAQAMGFGSIEKIYFIMPLAVNSFTSPIWILAFFAVNILPASFVIYFICIFYKKLNTIFMAKRTLRNFKLKEYKTNGIGKTLFVKEIKRLFSCPVYAINSLFGVVMALVASIGYSVFYLVFNVGVDSVSQAVFEIINTMLPAMFCFMFLLSPTTCASISLEGQAFWIIKTAPVSSKQIINSKLAVHAVFSTSVAFVCSIVIALCTGFTWLSGGLLVLCAVGISCFGGVFGLLMNLCFPKLKWENENVPVKQGLPVFLSTICSLLFVVLIFIIIFYASLSFEILLAIISSFFILSTIFMYVILYKNAKRLLNRLS